VITEALADETTGGEFQSEHAPSEMVDALRAAGVLRPEGAGGATSIFQVEVLTARHLGKPTLVFIPRQVESEVYEFLKLLRSGVVRPAPRPGTTYDPEPLISSGAWDTLDRDFVIQTGAVTSFGQIVFLERLRKETPNFISYYDRNNLQELREKLHGRVSDVSHSLIREHIAGVQNRIERRRGPLSLKSLQDLYREGLIISPVVGVLSGPAPTGPLFSTGGDDQGQAASLLIQGKSVLLLGDPGMGKSTACLFTFRDLARVRGAAVNPPAPLFASWREIPSDSATFEALIRFMLAGPKHREPWPAALDLPNLNWVLVLDGLDESQIERRELVGLLQDLSQRCTLMASCRRHDYERSFGPVRDSFNAVFELEPWGPPELSFFVEHLRAAGMQNGAAMLERWRADGQAPDLLTFPLWASMIAFLGERAPNDRPAAGDASLNEYQLLRACSDAVAEDEVRRQIASITSEGLRRLWMRSAWHIHRARREGTRLLLSHLLRELGVAEQETEKALCSLLEIRLDLVDGFFHEVFQEYWLSEFMIAKLTTEYAADEVPELFQYQRSVVTNRLLRSGIQARGEVTQVSERLREAFRNAELAGRHTDFVKNQVVYLLGRIDESPPTRGFLRSVWGTSTETPFVRYSAAFAAAMLGERSVEQQYYDLLNSSVADDEINRGYHLYYYGDIDLKESEMPPRDDGQSRAEATLRRLADRLRRLGTRHRNLRRIELFTIRRFLETGRALPHGVNLRDRVEAVLAEAEREALSPEFLAGVRNEVELIGRLLDA
jgi:hypothetical protein